MVALNPAYAPRESTNAVKNRVGDFFCESVDRAGSNRLSVHCPRLENEVTVTITASGLPYFLNSDPAQDGWNWYAYAAGNPMGYVDPTGLGTASTISAMNSGLESLGLAQTIVGSTLTSTSFSSYTNSLSGLDRGQLYVSTIPRESVVDLAFDYTRAAGSGAMEGLSSPQGKMLSGTLAMLLSGGSASPWVASLGLSGGGLTALTGMGEGVAVLSGNSDSLAQFQYIPTSVPQMGGALFGEILFEDPRVGINTTRVAEGAFGVYQSRNINNMSDAFTFGLDIINLGAEAYGVTGD